MPDKGIEPSRNWFWVSHVCQLHQSGMVQTKCSRDLPFNYLFSCDTVHITYFLSSIICVGTSDRTRTCNLHFRRVWHFQLCYGSILVTLLGVEPKFTVRETVFLTIRRKCLIGHASGIWTQRILTWKASELTTSPLRDTVWRLWPDLNRRSSAWQADGLDQLSHRAVFGGYCEISTHIALGKSQVF